MSGGSLETLWSEDFLSLFLLPGGLLFFLCRLLLSSKRSRRKNGLQFLLGAGFGRLDAAAEHRLLIRIAGPRNVYPPAAHLALILHNPFHIHNRLPSFRLE